MIATAISTTTTLKQQQQHQHKQTDLVGDGVCKEKLF
jgi:hypothetical protein